MRHHIDAPIHVGDHHFVTISSVDCSVTSYARAVVGRGTKTPLIVLMGNARGVYQLNLPGQSVPASAHALVEEATALLRAAVNRPQPKPPTQ